MRATGFAVGLPMLLLFEPPPSFGQPSLKPAFEVASVRASAPKSTTEELPNPNGVRSGGPGTSDPGRITFSRVPLDQILADAFNVRRDLIRGPDFIVPQRYDISAKVPEGTTEEQATRMLQNLLAERLALVAHLETKIIPGYELVVGPDGPKLSETSVDPKARAPLLPPVVRIAQNNTTFPELETGVRQATQYAPGSGRLYSRFSDTSLPEFAAFLGKQLGSEWRGGAAVGKLWVEPAAVLDQTGLTGRYDFTLDYEGFIMAVLDPSGTTTAIKGALEKQLGLRLVEAKVPVATLVIEHIEKTPAEN